MAENEDFSMAHSSNIGQMLLTYFRRMSHTKYMFLNGAALWLCPMAAERPMASGQTASDFLCVPPA